jgi:hypothetical protein
MSLKQNSIYQQCFGSGSISALDSHAISAWIWIRTRNTGNFNQTEVGCAVRFRFEAKRSENEAKNFSLPSEKMLFFRLFRFEAKNWKS